MVKSTASDVAIVGAGAAGSLIAHRLAAAGRKVSVFEAGPAWSTDDLASSQIWARRLKWGGPPVEVRANHHGFSHNLNNGWGLGGSALHHYATWPRMFDEAFAAWPFGYETLRPHYDRVQAEVGISGDAATEVWRPPGAAYPLPPTPTLAQGHAVARGFAAKGWPVSPLPVAVLSREYKGRPGCLYDGWCDAGCPIGALANPLVTHLAWAREAGADIRSGVTVTRVLPATAARAAGVEYVGADGLVRRHEAAHVVLAGGAVANPRLLLASAGGVWPEGAGNARDQVGRGFALDMLALAYGRMPGPTEPHRGLSAGQLLNRVRGPRDRPGAPPGTPVGAWQWQIAPAMKPNDIFGVAVSRADLFGAGLAAFVEGATRDIASMAGMIGQACAPTNRVMLASTRDRFGVPHARVEHRVTDAEMALWRHVQAEGIAVMRAGGAREAWGGPFAAGHMIGGTLIGDDPARSVADAFGRVHGIDNVWLAGSGLFPGSCGVSPTFTLMALADRSAAALLAG